MGAHYTDTLQKIYKTGFEFIVKKYPAIELFTTEYISFCDMQRKCNLVRMIYDSIAGQDYLIYKNKKYPIDIVKDTSYYAFGENPYFADNASGLHIGSVRIYKSGTMKIVMVHLATGHEMAMGWITSDPNKKPQVEGETIILAKEHKPRFAFKDIKKGVYEEPLLHHGYGFDIFVIE